MALTTIANKDFYNELFKDGTGEKYTNIMPNIIQGIKS